MAEQWLSIVEYARTFSVSDMTVRRRIKTGKLHAVLKDGKYYIPVARDKNGNPQKPTREAAPVPAPRAAAPEKAPEKPIVKAHPAAQKTVAQYPFPVPEGFEIAPQQAIAPPAHAPTYAPQPNYIPVQQQVYAPLPSYAAPMPAPPQEMPQSADRIRSERALAELCNQLSSKMQTIESRVEDAYRNRMQSLELHIRNRDMEIASLRQQIEDLQVLIKILERRPPG